MPSDLRCSRWLRPQPSTYERDTRPLNLKYEERCAAQIACCAASTPACTRAFSIPRRQGRNGPMSWRFCSATAAAAIFDDPDKGAIRGTRCQRAFQGIEKSQVSTCWTRNSTGKHVARGRLPMTCHFLPWPITGTAKDMIPKTRNIEHSDAVVSIHQLLLHSLAPR